MHQFPQPAPEPILSLMTSDPSTNPKAKQFKDNIRAYNSTLQMASSGIQLAQPQNGISMLAIKGAVYHRMGPLLPAQGAEPQFAQLYILDNTDQQLAARQVATRSVPGVVSDTLAEVQQCLLDNNAFVRRLKQVCDLAPGDTQQYELVIKTNGDVDRRRYNAPQVPEVVGLMPGERACIWAGVKGSDPCALGFRPSFIHFDGAPHPSKQTCFLPHP